MADGTSHALEFTVGFPFCGIGLGALGFQAASARLFGREMHFRALGGIDFDKVAAAQFELFTKSPCLVADVHALSVEQLRAFWPKAPDVIFTSPPCKGFSQLTSKAARASEKYQRMNRLALDWINLQLAAWGDDGPRLVLLENVPGLASAGAPLLREIEKALRAKGYVMHRSTHDCGELGGLAQHRRRFLLVARHAKRCSALLYQPRKRPLRGVGEVIGALPLPGDPAAGPLHRLPRISLLNWIRLALIPPGGDWRDIPGTIPAGLTRNQVFRRYRTLGWGETAPTITGSGSNAVASVEDPRIATDNPRRHANKFRVTGWGEPAGTITGTDGRIGSGAPLVADVRVSTAYDAGYGVLGWSQPARTVAGMSAVGCGAYAVADPRVPSAMPQSYGLLAWSAPMGTVTGRACVTTGAFSVADPRITCAGRNGFYGVLGWSTVANTVTGSMQIDNGPAAVSDPRIPGSPELRVAWYPRDLRSAPPFPLVLPSVSGHWHRPLTTLECAVLQGFDAADTEGQPFDLDGGTDACRVKIGDAVPVTSAEAIARQMLFTLVDATVGSFSLSSAGNVWVREREARGWVPLSGRA